MDYYEESKMFVILIFIGIIVMILGSIFIYFNNNPESVEQDSFDEGLILYTYARDMPQKEVDKYLDSNFDAHFCIRGGYDLYWCFAGTDGTIRNLTLKPQSDDGGVKDE